MSIRLRGRALARGSVANSTAETAAARLCAEYNVACVFPGDPEHNVQALFQVAVLKSDFLSRRDRLVPKRLLRLAADTVAHMLPA